MTWLLVKLGIRLLGFIGVFWLAAAKNPKIKIEPRWSIPLVAGYKMSTQTDGQLGYVVGMAWEKPEIAARIAACTCGSP